MRTWLMLDSTYLCHRAYHSTGGLQFEGEPTGVIYGYLQAIKSLRTRFATERIVHIWDHGKGLREQRYPFYKERRRRDNSDENVKKHEIMQPQIERLKNEIIPLIGYKNNFMQVGYEADDIIAKIVLDAVFYRDEKNKTDEYIIVTGDQDMYQLISGDDQEVVVYHPKDDTIVSLKCLRKLFGVSPKQWIQAKVIAGCSTDEIPGVQGVGLKTACQYLNGTLKATNKKAIAIQQFLKSPDASRNLVLVRLPFKGVKDFDLHEDKREDRLYRKILSECGIKSLE